jgi:hypothetical protein
MEAVAVMPMVMGDAENAIHCADRSTNTRADRTADDRTDRAGGAATLS